jgi:hypothetical protein
MNINNTFYRTLRNKDRHIPFYVWWVGVFAVAVAGLFSSLVRVLTLCILMPNWEMRVLGMVMKWEFSKRKNQHE